MGTGLQCQVVHRTDRWPYQFRCKNSATFTLQNWVRANNPGIEAEFICTQDAEAAIAAFGKESVEKL